MIASTTGGRTWIKLFVRGWLDGTVRYQMEPAERALFTDLLVLAANTRLTGVEGVVAIGETKGVINPYSAEQLAAKLFYPVEFVRATLKKFVAQDRITVKDDVIYINGWSKFQSDYSRQRKYRNSASDKHTSKVTSGVTTRLRPEVEVDVDVDREADCPPSPLKGEAGVVLDAPPIDSFIDRNLD